MKKRKGSADIQIMTYIGIFFLLIAFYLIEQALYPHILYANIRSVERKYSLMMESEGYLSPSDYSNFVSDLAALGLNMPDVTIQYTASKVDYNSDVGITVTYNYRRKTITVNGFNVTQVETIEPMKIDFTTVYKGS